MSMTTSLATRCNIPKQPDAKLPSNHMQMAESWRSKGDIAPAVALALLLLFLPWMTDWLRRGSKGNFLANPPPIWKFQCRELSLHPPPAKKKKNPYSEIFIWVGVQWIFPLRGLQGNFPLRGGDPAPHVEISLHWTLTKGGVARKFSSQEVRRKFPCNTPPPNMEISLQLKFLAMKFPCKGVATKFPFNKISLE